jgi:hypothetical protein
MEPLTNGAIGLCHRGDRREYRTTPPDFTFAGFFVVFVLDMSIT